MYISKDKFDSIYCGPVKNLLKEIDYTLFNINNAHCLYYFFPLIERLVIETLALSSLLKIEKDEQGTLRTLNSVLCTEECKQIFDDKILKKLSYYFNEIGLRNKMMHYDPKNSTIEISKNELNEVKEIALRLLDKYNQEYQKYDFEHIQDIQPLSLDERIRMIRQKDVELSDKQQYERKNNCNRSV